MREKEPILSEWHRGEEVSDEKIAEGHISGKTGKREGVRRKVYETPEGARFYVYKEVMDKKEAEDSMSVYLAMKRANISVVKFAKVIKKKSEAGKVEYKIAMEDLTENGLFVVSEPVEDNLIPKNEIPIEIKEEMFRILGKIHNLGLYDWHRGISLVVRGRKVGEKLDDFECKVIDYANFREARRTKDFSTECERNVAMLLKGLHVNDEEEEQQLRSIYAKSRQEL